MWSGGQLCLQDWSQGDPDHDDDDDPDDPDDLDDNHDNENGQKKVEKLDLQKTEYALFPSLIHQVGGKSHHCWCVLFLQYSPIFSNILQYSPIFINIHQ